MWFNERARSSKKCVLKSCGEKRTGNESLSLFSFPKDPVRCGIWLNNCQLDADSHSLKNILLCSKHFEKKMFLNDLRNRLQPHAIPTFFPDRKDSQKLADSTSCVEDKPLDISSTGSVITCTSEDSCVEDILRTQIKNEMKARLKAEKTVMKLRKQQAKYESVEHFLDLCQKHLSPDVLTIVKSHMTEKKPSWIQALEIPTEVK
ncbi:uncharacterized protein LOC126845523 isoform X1 [Adelges cooleyi]|uniref:uncharacterized protein LOC126845523 isoform X1 n=2 Tax=Adelges cooleyi TaxID=133065 RepID=UPI00218007E3|nr:uncharacterized protein LOC126845523 isoform X1 [Adelges cooleyi]